MKGKEDFMTFFPDMSTFLEIGGLRITWYAIIILTGALLGYYLTLRQTRKWGYKDEVFENFFLMMLPISIVGARLYYVIFEWQQYVDDPLSILFTWNGGLAIHGGLIAAVVFGLWYFRKHHIDVLRVADAAFPNVLLAQAIGRWGNFMNHEAYGQVVSENFFNGWPAFIKDNMFIDGSYRQPTFLFESIGNLIGFAVITFVYKKYGRKKRGDLAWAYVTWYGMVRFIVESMRSDSLMIGPLKIAQVISLIGIVAGICGLLGVFNKLFKKTWIFKKRKPVIIFDLDGTLVDTKELVYQSFIHTFAKYKPGYVLKDDELNSFFGPTLRDTFSHYFDASMIDEIIAYYRAFNHEHHDELVKEMPGVKETLHYLQENEYPMAVLSNKLRDTVVMGLEHFQLASYFEIIYGGEDVSKPKPDPSGLIQICADLHMPIDDLIYVGDAPGDIRACKNMGAYSIAFISDEKRADEMQKEKPCAMINNMKDIIQLVKEDLEWNDNTI